MKQIKQALIFTTFLSSFFIVGVDVEALEVERVNRFNIYEEIVTGFSDFKSIEIYLADQSHGEIIEIITVYDEILGIDNLNTFVPYLDINDGGGTSNISRNFSNVSWINRDGMWSLSLSPKLGLNGMFVTGDSVDMVWGYVKTGYQWHTQWNYKNIDSMQGQFRCHYFYSYLKTPWNIEPSKATYNSITCN